MSLKLLTCFVFSAAMLLGACSSIPTGSGPAAPVAETVTLLQEAKKAVDRATAAARSAAAPKATKAVRDRARELIDEAFKALDAAEEEANRAARSGSAAALGRATRELNEIARCREILNDALASFAWYRKNLVRFRIARGDVAVPRDGVNIATRTPVPRTINMSETDNTQKVNPDAIKSTTFKPVMYADGKMLLSDGERKAPPSVTKDEFKVDGYVTQRNSASNLDTAIYTGLRITNIGLDIHIGGTRPDSSNNKMTDYTDMRKDITAHVDDADADGTVDETLRGQNGWDLEIAFDEPQTRPVPVDYDYVPDPVSSWRGNGAFYWRSLVPADDSQKSGGVNHEADAFNNQPTGQENLGMYEVWLSNHIGVKRNLEPPEGRALACPSGITSTFCPKDDNHLYLKYAAYGLFVYTAGTDTFIDATNSNGQIGRINTMHFGYQAFANQDGQRTTDIGEAITRGKFKGYTIAYEIQGDQQNLPLKSKLLRGDVSLTVNVPKGSGEGSLEGTMNNFQSWNNETSSWTAYTAGFTITLRPANIGADGMFNGIVQANPETGFGYVEEEIEGEVFRYANGVYKGSFYGPRADKNDLEIAGSWSVGEGDATATNKDLRGSFGAKQDP